MMRVWLVLLSCFVLVGNAAAADPVERLADARDPAAVHEAALRLGKALNEGCCFGREREIAQIAHRHLAGCPRDPALVSALNGMLGTIGRSVVLQDRALARRVFVELPRACIARVPHAWQAYAELLMHGGLAVAEADPGALSEAIEQLIGSARGDPERMSQIVQWLDHFHLELGASLPPLDETTVDALIDSAGNSLHKLPDLFSRLPARAGTAALLRLAERRNFVVPPELARWVDAGAIREDAMRRLAGRELEPRDLERVQRLATDADPRVASAARTLLASGRSGNESDASAIQAGNGTDNIDRLIAQLAPGDASEQSRAAWQLAEYLLAHPGHRTVRETLRRMAEADSSAMARAHAWRALLATDDPRFTWQRVIGKIRSPVSRLQALETLKLIDMPVPSRLLATLPDALVETLLDLARDRRQDTRLRLEALGTARRLGEWALDIFSRGYTPDEADRQKADEGRARAFLRRFTTITEPRIRALFKDPDPGIRREAVYWFAAIPARDPSTAEALLVALDDPSEYVRDNAAMALAVVQSAPSGIAARLETRIARGDPDPNVVRKLHEAQSALLCADPQARDRLAAVILHEEGDRRARQFMAKRCRLDGRAARVLLDRLDGALVQKLLENRTWSIEEMVRAEEDPEPWQLVSRIVPVDARDAWLLEQASRPGLARAARLRLLRLAENRNDPAYRERLWAELVAGVQSGELKPKDFLDLYAPLGYASIRKLAEGFANDAKGLERATRLVAAAESLAARCAAAGSSCGSVPQPGAEDLPWIAQQLGVVARDTRRLGLLVRLLGLYTIGQRPELQRKAWEMGITPVLLEAMRRPGGCEAVRPAIHSLLGRMTPPSCGQATTNRQ